MNCDLHIGFQPARCRCSTDRPETLERELSDSHTVLIYKNNPHNVTPSSGGERQ